MKIALSGKMMSGKSVVASYLVDKYGFTEFAFADALKDIAVYLFGMNRQYKDRNLLQLVGNKLREIDSHVWIRYLQPYIELNREKDIVVSDVRFQNELWSLKDMGFKTVRCYVGSRIQRQRIQVEMPSMPKELLNDISETDLDAEVKLYWDYIISNDGCTMDELLKQIDTMIELFKGLELYE